MAMKNYEPNLQPDPHRLDEEWVKQPELYRQWANEAADARRELDEAKNELAATRAETSFAIRTNPSDYDLNKVTEAGIGEVLLQQKQVQHAESAVVEARHRLDVVNGIVTALDHKRKALESLVSLHLSSYYASPRAPEGTKEAMDVVEKQDIRSRGKRSR